MKISNKLYYNNGRNTLMQYLMTLCYQSFVPHVKTYVFRRTILQLLTMFVVCWCIVSMLVLVSMH